jgi:hypothetical protein
MLFLLPTTQTPKMRKLQNGIIFQSKFDTNHQFIVQSEVHEVLWRNESRQIGLAFVRELSKQHNHLHWVRKIQRDERCSYQTSRNLQKSTEIHHSFRSNQKHHQFLIWRDRFPQAGKQNPQHR